MKVPFLDLKAAHREVDAELDSAFRRVKESGRYVLGPELEAFEGSLRLTVKHGIVSAFRTVWMRYI